MSTRATTLRSELQARTLDTRTGQYTVWQVFGIWLLGGAPMWLLAWVVAPVLVPRSPLPAGITYWLLMIAGMAWEFMFSLAILYRELGTLSWRAIRQRTWLQTPRDPKTDQPNPKLFWWLLPALLFAALTGFFLSGYLNTPISWLFPGLHPLPYQDTSQLAALDLKGQWWLLGIALVSLLFNYFLGEELLFRGILLPRMQRTFGKYDWVANAFLFGLYHLHKPWGIPTNIVGAFAITWPARRFRSNWMAIVVHAVEGLITLVAILAVILGMNPR